MSTTNLPPRPFDGLPDVTAVATGILSITQSDTQDLPQIVRAIEATDADGAAAVVMVNPWTGSETEGSVYLLRGVPKDGFFKRVKSTGTTPSTIIGYL